jgi:hypothetical protein
MHLKRFIFLLVIFYIPSAFAQNAGTLVCNTGTSSYTTIGGQLIGTHQYPTSCYYYYTNFGYSGNGSSGGNPPNGGSTGSPQGTIVTTNAPTSCQYDSVGFITNATDIQVIAETLGRQSLGRDFLPGDEVRLFLTGNPNHTDRFTYRSDLPGRLLLQDDSCGVTQPVSNPGGGGYIP